VLDRDGAVVADGVQRRQESRPVDLAEAGQSRHLPADPAREGAVAMQPVAPHLEVLRMHVEDPIGEVVDGALVVDHQPDEVRRVEVQAEPLVGDRGEHLVPDRRRPREVVAAGPLVVREDHRAVLDRDPYAVTRCVRDELRPHGTEPLEVLRQRAVLVVADERADGRDAEPRCGVDDLPQVTVHLCAMRVVGVEVVRVVRERRDLEPVPVEEVSHLARVERVDVDVRHAGVAPPLARARRPARDLQRPEAVFRAPARDLLQRQLRERRRQQAELHVSTSTHRCSRSDAATASASTFSTWPARNVG
jgi:hypothetical protein